MKGIWCISPEFPFEILNIDPCLREDPNQRSFLQFPVKRDGEDTPFFLHDNVTRSLPFRLKPLLREILDQICPGDNREFMRHLPLRPWRSRGGVQEISGEVLPAGLQEQVLLLL